MYRFRVHIIEEFTVEISLFSIPRIVDIMQSTRRVSPRMILLFFPSEFRGKSCPQRNHLPIRVIKFFDGNRFTLLYELQFYKASCGGSLKHNRLISPIRKKAIYLQSTCV